MSHSPAQKTLGVAIGKRNQAEENLQKYKATLYRLQEVDAAAQKAEADAQANLNQLMQEKIKTGVDATANARAVYSQAMLDLQIATTEHEAGKVVVMQAEHELTQLGRSASRAAVDVARAIAEAHVPGLLTDAKRYSNALQRYKALVRFARAASADSGLISDPIPDLANSNNALRLRLDELINRQTLDDSFTLTEASLLDAKLDIGGA